jgi:hypothetical protein
MRKLTLASIFYYGKKKYGSLLHSLGSFLKNISFLVLGLYFAKNSK